MASGACMQACECPSCPCPVLVTVTKPSRAPLCQDSHKLASTSCSLSFGRPMPWYAAILCRYLSPACSTSCQHPCQVLWRFQSRLSPCLGRKPAVQRCQGSGPHQQGCSALCGSAARRTSQARAKVQRAACPASAAGISSSAKTCGAAAFSAFRANFVLVSPQHPDITLTYLAENIHVAHQ